MSEQTEIVTEPVGIHQHDCRILSCENGFIVNATFYGRRNHPMHKVAPLDPQVVAENKCFVFATQSEMIAWINRYFSGGCLRDDTAETP